MHVLTRWLTRWHGVPAVAALFAIVVPVVFIMRSTTSDGSTDVGHLLALGALLVAVLILALYVVVMLAGLDPDAQEIAHRLAPGADQQRLLTRWLERTRWARNVGGLVGLTWWVLGTSLQGDILLYGVGGVAIGSMAAQLHHVRRPSGPRTASLDQRSVSDYLEQGAGRRLQLVAAMAAAMVVGALTVADAESAIGWGLAAIVLLGAVYLVQHRVAARPRPALSAGLREADDLARELAIGRGLAQPATYGALALIAHGALQFEASLGGGAVAISVAAWLYAFYSWWQNRRLGLDWVMDQPIAATV